MPKTVKLNVDINCTVEMSVRDWKDWCKEGSELGEMESALYLAPHDTVHDAWITSVDRIEEVERT